jgi:hypothetical protein
MKAKILITTDQGVTLINRVFDSVKISLNKQITTNSHLEVKDILTVNAETDVELEPQGAQVND